MRNQPVLRMPRSWGWFADLWEHYVDLARKRRWRLLAGELFALSWSLVVLAAASFPRLLAKQTRQWLGDDRPRPKRLVHKPITQWQRRADLTAGGLLGFAALALLVPAAPNPAMVEENSYFEMVPDPKSLIDLLADFDAPEFAMGDSVDPLVLEDLPQGRSVPRGNIDPGVLSAPLTTPIASAIRAVPPEGLTHTVEEGESLWTICRSYNIKLEDVIAWNDMQNPNRLSVGTKIFLPGAANRPKPIEILNPISGKLRVSSGFGMRVHPILRYLRPHKGVDLRANSGTPIRAVMDGVVIETRYDSYYGNFIRIRHNDDLVTLYGHCSKTLVKKGDRIQSGQIIGKVGMTGLATGPHLHFEIIENGTHRNPMSAKYLGGRRRGRG